MSHRLPRSVLGLVLAVAAVAAGAAQAPGNDAQDTAPTFRVESRLIVLHVRVLDRRGQPVRHLGRDAFTVLEDGVPQTISFFGDEDVPVTVGLVVDHSGSMLARQGMVRRAVAAFAAASRANDEVFTVVFNDRPQLGLPGGAAFTHSADLVQASLRRFAPGGRTALYDGVAMGLTHLEQAAHPQRLLVVLSDGDDNASLLQRAALMERLARLDVTVDAVSTARVNGDIVNDDGLSDMARATGGRLYRPANESAFEAAFHEIGTRIRYGYSLGYMPANTDADGRRRRISVDVRSPQRGVVVRTRDSYLAAGGLP